MDLKPGMQFEGAVNRYWRHMGPADGDLFAALDAADPAWLNAIGSYRIIIQSVHEPAVAITHGGNEYPIAPPSSLRYVTYNSHFVQQGTGVLFEISNQKRSTTFHDSIICETNMGVMRPIGDGSCPSCGGSGKISNDKMMEIAEIDFRQTAEAAIKNGSSYISYWMPSIMVSPPEGASYFVCPTCSKKLETVAHLGTRVLDL